MKLYYVDVKIKNIYYYTNNNNQNKNIYLPI
jgi:hypothetical protein